MIRTHTFTRLTTVGSAGSGAGSVSSSHPLNGKLLSIAVTQGNTPHANTDIVISVVNSGTARTVFTLTNYSTTTLTWFNPRAAVVSQANVALVYAASDPVTDYIPLDGVVTVTIAEGGSASTCDVVLQYED